MKRKGRILLWLILIAALAFEWKEFRSLPFEDGVAFDRPAFVCADADGSVYVLDSGLSRVVATDADGVYRWTLESNGERTFATASLMAAQPNGGLYLVADDGKRLISCDANGLAVTEVYAAQSDERIIALSCSQDGALFAVRTATELRLLQLSNGEAVSLFAQARAASAEESYAISDSSLLISTASGDVLRLSADGTTMLFEGSGGLHGNRSLAGALCSDEFGHVYFVNYGDRTISCLGEGGALRDVTPDREAVSAQAFVDRLPTTALSVSDSRVYVIRDGVVSVGDENGALLRSFAKASYSPLRMALRIVLWLSLLAVVLRLIVLGVSLLCRRRAHPQRTETQRIVLGVCLFAAIVCVTLAVSLPDLFSQTNDELVMDKLASLGRTVGGFAIGDDAAAIQSVDDVGSEPFERIRTKLDTFIAADYTTLTDLYYVLYVTDGESVFALLDSTGALKPFEAAQRSFEGSDTQLYNYNQHLQMNYPVYSDADGDWAFSVVPVENTEGEVVGIVELGADSRKLHQQLSGKMVGLLATLLTLVVVLFMSYHELLQYRGFRLLRRSKDTCADAALLRTLSFVFYLSASLQSAFVAILASRLYTPLWGISEGVALAVPISASLAATSVTGLLCGRLLEKHSPRTLIIAGSVILALSFGLIGAFLSFQTLILGRLLSGVGQGLIAVSINTLAATDREHREEAFGSQNAGMMAGLNLGMVFGAQCLEWIGYRGVYVMAAVIALTAGVLARLYLDNEQRATNRREAASHGSLRSLVTPRVATFLLGVFLPYMVASYYLYYFFPLFADANGMSEAMIGRFYLLAGLIVTGVGPKLTELIHGRMGERNANLFANICYALLLLFFATFPTMTVAILLVLLLSVVDSFAFPEQSVFFSGLAEVREFGSAKAMGIYGLMEHASETAAPFAFAAALSLGNAAGVAVIGAGCLALLPLFVVATRARGKEGSNGHAVK